MAFRLESFRPAKGQLAFVVIGLAALYVILPQVGIFRNSLSYMAQAEWRYLGLAAFFQIATYLFATTTYVLLAKHRLKFSRMLLIQLAGSFVNRLLPAGIGGIGVNYAYLKANKHSGAQSASVVAVNNLLGGLGNLLLIAIIFFALSSSLVGVHINSSQLSHGFKYALLTVAIIATLLLVTRYRRKIGSSVVVFVKQIIEYRKQPQKLFLALCSSILLTLSNVLCLYYSAHALSVHLGLASALVVLTVGIAFGTATPTPGGLGGIDAALVAALVAFGVAAGPALAVTLVFRLISCWLPILAGVGALYLAERNNYFNSPTKILELA